MRYPIIDNALGWDERSLPIIDLALERYLRTECYDRAVCPNNPIKHGEVMLLTTFERRECTSNARAVDDMLRKEAKKMDIPWREITKWEELIIRTFTLEELKHRITAPLAEVHISRSNDSYGGTSNIRSMRYVSYEPEGERIRMTSDEP